MSSTARQQTGGPRTSMVSQERTVLEVEPTATHRATLQREAKRTSSDADRAHTQHNSNGRAANATPLPADAASAVPERNALIGGASAVPDPINTQARASAAPVLDRDDVQVQRALEGTDTTQGDVLEPVLDVLSNSGQPLDQPIQRALEDHLGSSLDHVRIHTGARPSKRVRNSTTARLPWATASPSVPASTTPSRPLVSISSPTRSSTRSSNQTHRCR